jgi:tRNA(Arg) A34 adenosine deaminase TadA
MLKVHNIDIIAKLKKKSENSNLNSRHSAALICNGKIESLGYNFRKGNSDFSIHAEVSALKLFKYKGGNGKANRQSPRDIIVIKVSNSRKILGNSRPCNHCIEILKKNNIRKIYYSNEKGEIESEYINEMENKHLSSYHRFKGGLK